MAELARKLRAETRPGQLDRLTRARDSAVMGAWAAVGFESPTGPRRYWYLLLRRADTEWRVCHGQEALATHPLKDVLAEYVRERGKPATRPAREHPERPPAAKPGANEKEAAGTPQRQYRYTASTEGPLEGLQIR